VWWLLISLGWAGPSADEVDGITGRWVLSDSSEVLDQRLETSLEETVQSMSWAFRSFARPKLAKTMDYCGSYDFDVSAQTMGLVCHGADDQPFRRPWGDRQDPLVGNDGKTYEVGLQFNGGRIETRFTEGSTVAVYTYDFSTPGRLLVTKRIEHQMLNKPLIWRMNYRKQR